MKIIACLNSYVHDTTNSVIEGSSMRFYNIFRFISNKRYGHEEILFKLSVYWSDYWIFNFILYLFPNSIVWYSWWYVMSNQLWWHVSLGLCWYWGALVLALIKRYNQSKYQIIWSVFQNKSHSVFPWGYHMFQLQ